MEAWRIQSLADLAARTFCGVLDDLVETVFELHSSLPDSFISTSFVDDRVVLHFIDDLFLPEAVAEKLIYTMSNHRSLNDFTLSMFDHKSTRLRRLRIPNASGLTAYGLQTLKKHNLKELDLNRVHISLHALVGLLNEWTVQNLETLRVCNSTLTDSHGFGVPSTNLMKLTNLEELDVCYTNFNSHNLDIIADHLTNLQALNISSTRIDTILPLRKCSQLRYLSMNDLKLSPANSEMSQKFDEILLNMKELRHLDVSCGGCAGPLDNFMSTEKATYVFKITNWPDQLPQLISLDISGQEDVNESSLMCFLKHHQNLIFLGLMSTVSKSKMFLDRTNPNYRSDLKVTGIGSLEQISLAMRLYSKRPSLIQKCLYTLYSVSKNEKLGPRPDMIELVTEQMFVHQESLQVQVACTACIYNLTNANLSDNIPQVLLRIVVERTLHAMERFSSYFQVQKNALLTLCNDRILRDTEMDRFRCAQAVLNALRKFNDQLIERLAVAIASVVAAKISSAETNIIGSCSQNMKKLLEIIQRKLLFTSIDSTLGFTLSTLWNLTDESPRTCSEFLNQDGLNLLIQLLQKTKNSESVLTKILGLLSNIAEVPALRNKLMDAEIIGAVSSLLKSDSIEISYFAAGILAHLFCDGATSWTISMLPRDTLLLHLECTILSWKQSSKEIVAYRSFRPFVSLLKCYQTYQAQLWSLWAIQHVLRAHAQKYYEMLEAESIFEILHELSCANQTNHRVRDRAFAILQQSSQFKAKKISAFCF